MSNGPSSDLQVNAAVVGLDIGYGKAESGLNAGFEVPETVVVFHGLSAIVNQVTDEGVGLAEREYPRTTGFLKVITTDSGHLLPSFCGSVLLDYRIDPLQIITIVREAQVGH